MKKHIISDLQRLYPGRFSYNKFLKGLSSKGFKYLVFLRIAKYSNNKLVVLIAKSIKRILAYRYGFQLPVQTEIGHGLFIGHFGTLVVSADAVIGNNCNLAHNVTIGAARGKRGGAPKLGDKVWIGTGAVLVGGISIGSDVLIAPNSFVNFDVPSHSIVIGNPGKIVEKENPTEYYINNCCELCL